MHYLTRIDHFTFRADGDQLVVQSERDDSFEQRYDWPDGCSATDEDLQSTLHEEFYLDLREAFNNE